MSPKTLPLSKPKYNYRAVCKAAALALTRAQRQDFMDHIQLGFTIGAAQDAVGCSFEAALGILNLNTVTTTHHSMNWRSK